MPAQAFENELIGLEKKYWTALRDRDVETILDLTDDSCIVTGPQGMGSLEKEQVVEMMKSANYTLTHFEIEDDFKVSLVRDDVAVVAYKVHEDLSVDGEPIHLDATDASTWVKRDGKWVCALHTEALLGDPFGRDRRPVDEPQVSG
jgi:hypothetical protein